MAVLAQVVEDELSSTAITRESSDPKTGKVRRRLMLALPSGVACRWLFLSAKLSLRQLALVFVLERECRVAHPADNPRYPPVSQHKALGSLPDSSTRA